jgi:hypothetical protein
MQMNPIPTLEEVFETVGHQTFINIELTNYDPHSIHCWESCRTSKNTVWQPYILSSFHPSSSAAFTVYYQIFRSALLASRGRAGFLARSRFGRLLVPYQAIHPERSDATPSFIQRPPAWASGECLHVNEEDNMRQLFHLEVDAFHR